jgi:hypothetical protein
MFKLSTALPIFYSTFVAPFPCFGGVADVRIGGINDPISGTIDMWTHNDCKHSVVPYYGFAAFPSRFHMQTFEK